MTTDASPVVPILPWWAGGLAIGIVLVLAVALVQPLGVSMQYVVLDGLLLHHVLPEVADQSAYLAEAGRGWTLASFEFFFVTASRSVPFLLRWRPSDSPPGSCLGSGRIDSDRFPVGGWSGR